MTKYLTPQGAGGGESNIKELLNSFKIKKVLKSYSTSIKEYRKKERKRKRKNNFFFLLIAGKKKKGASSNEKRNKPIPKGSS